jgi:hypothetical protein
MLIRVVRESVYNVEVPDGITIEQLHEWERGDWDPIWEMCVDTVEDYWHFIPTPGTTPDEVLDELFPPRSEHEIRTQTPDERETEEGIPLN